MKKLLGLTLLVISVFTAPLFADSGRTVIFPRFASGNGWTSEFFFANQGILTVSDIVIYFYDQNGNTLSVQSNLGSNHTYTFSLAAGATQVIRITSGSTFLQGYAVVNYPSFYSPVRGSQIYRYEQNGVVQVEVGIPQQEQGYNFSFPVEIDSSQHIYPAVALTNPMSVAQTLILSLIKPDGSIQSIAKLPLAAGKHFAAFLDDNALFPGLDNFTGTVSVSGPLGIGVLTLRQDNQAFGAISTDGGPIIAPFVVTDIFASDDDPSDANSADDGYNDNFDDAQALILPVQVNGSIGFADDWDFYKFSGQAGKILTVICDTSTQSDSYLDSIVQVFDSSNLSDPIASNDQNGLAPGGYPLNDSFVQVVLPHAGLYYIVVTDFNGNGDTTHYGYNLHLSVR